MCLVQIYNMLPMPSSHEKLLVTLCVENTDSVKVVIASNSIIDMPALQQ